MQPSPKLEIWLGFRSAEIRRCSTVEASLRNSADPEVEVTLSQSEQRYRQQYMGAPTPTYSWRAVGDDFVLEDFNEAAETATSGGVREWSGARASRVYAGYPHILADLTTCATEQRTLRRETLFRQPSADHERTLALTYVFVPVGLVMLQTEDVTERKQAETKRETLAATLCGGKRTCSIWRRLPSSPSTSTGV
jgi:hypothetical protein